MKLLNIKTFLYHSWGFSLRGRVISYATSAKAFLQITPLLHEIIVGSMLGDLTAERPNSNRNTRLIFKQSAAHKEYIDHLFSLFTLYCGSKPIVLSRFDSRLNRMKTYVSIKFQTFSLPCFNVYKELFYNADGVKIVPSNIMDLLTARGLAYWFMDPSPGWDSLMINPFSLKESGVLNTLMTFSLRHLKVKL